MISMTLDHPSAKSRFLLLVRHAFKYYLVGGTGILVNLGILYALTEFAGLWYLLSAGIAIYVSVTSNFALNKKWTFKDYASTQRTLIMYAKFLGISLLGAGIQLGFIYLFVEVMALYYILSAFISIVIAGSFVFILNRRWSFGIKL